MVTTEQAAPTLELLRGRAEAERLATTMEIAPNPWLGAAKALELAEHKAAEAAAKEAKVAAQRVERERADAFVGAVALHRQTQRELRACEKTISDIESRLGELSEAGELLDKYRAWRTTASGVEAEMIRRDHGVMDQSHMLFGLSESRRAELHEVEQLRIELTAALAAKASPMFALESIISAWPALRDLEGELS